MIPLYIVDFNIMQSDSFHIVHTHSEPGTLSTKGIFMSYQGSATNLLAQLLVSALTQLVSGLQRIRQPTRSEGYWCTGQHAYPRQHWSDVYLVRQFLDGAVDTLVRLLIDQYRKATNGSVF
jgi:hypothetical protein